MRHRNAKRNLKFEWQEYFLMAVSLLFVLGVLNGFRFMWGK